MRTLITTACLAVLGLTGCATEPTNTTAQQVAVAADADKNAEADAGSPGKIESTQDAEDRVICRQITPTGSHRKKTICRKVSDIRRDRESAQDALRKTKGAGMQGPGDT